MDDISDAENAQQDQSTSSASSTWVSSHFSRKEVDGVIKRACLAVSCQQLYSDRTSHVCLRRHWDRKHSSQTLVRRRGHTFHDTEHNDLLIKMIIDTQNEYALVDRPSFRRFTNSLCSTKKLICRKTVSRLIEQSSGYLRENIRQALEDEVAISLTFDIWSPKKGASGYACITGHFINSDWQLKSLILEFQLIPHPHDAPAICDFMKTAIVDLNIQDKILAITTDNGPNVVAAIGLLEKDLRLKEKFPNIGFTHFRCLGHVLHLAVQKALKQLNSQLIDSRKLNSAIRSSAKRNEAFLKCQQVLLAAKDPDFNEKAPLELIDDLESRWNSTYLMLQRLVRLKKPVQIMQSTHVALRELETIDWLYIEELEAFLKPLYTMTNKFSGERFCTISAVSSLIPMCLSYLEGEYHDLTIKKAADELKIKLMKYIKHVEKEVILAANILDPRFKNCGISQEALDIGSQFIRKIIEREPNESVSSVELNADEPDLFDGIYRLEAEAEDELQSYLGRDREGKNSDIMKSWSVKSSNYPKLARLARMVLPIQATSTASERLFSIAGETLTERRNRLHPDNFRSNILNKSWLEFLD